MVMWFLNMIFIIFYASLKNIFYMIEQKERKIETKLKKAKRIIQIVISMGTSSILVYS